MDNTLPLILFSLLTLGVTCTLATPYTDFVRCVEQKQCGLFSVCGFTLVTPPTDGSQLSSNRTYEPLSGYLMRVSNGLSYDVQLTWDILGSATLNTTCKVNSTVKRSFTLTEHNSRYFNTHCQGLHTIRLQVGNDTADTEIANPEFTCTTDQACEYLVRACFANNDDPLCVDYAYYCQAILKYSTLAIDTLRQSCIPECLADFYANKIANPYQFKSDEIVNTMLQSYYKLVSQSPPSLDSASNTQGRLIFIILVSALVVIAISVAIIVYIYKKTGFKFSRRAGGRV